MSWPKGRSRREYNDSHPNSSNRHPNRSNRSRSNDLNRPYPNDDLGRRFSAQCYDAARQGIVWMLTFEEWLRIWNESGHLPNRGCRNGQYVMARHGDKGPYAVGNVSIITCNENARMARKTPQFLLQQRKGRPKSRIPPNFLTPLSRIAIISNRKLMHY